VKGEKKKKNDQTFYAFIKGKKQSDGGGGGGVNWKENHITLIVYCDGDQGNCIKKRVCHYSKTPRFGRKQGEGKEVNYGRSYPNRIASVDTGRKARKACGVNWYCIVGAERRQW